MSKERYFGDISSVGLFINGPSPVEGVHIARPQTQGIKPSGSALPIGFFLIASEVLIQRRVTPYQFQKVLRIQYNLPRLIDTIRPFQLP